MSTTSSTGYWRAAAVEIRSLRKLVFAALIVALCLAIKSLRVPVGENLNIYFTFLPRAFGAAIYGPIMGLLVGAVGDTLGYLMDPFGPYFPGYLLSEMAGNFIFGLVLYRRRITIVRLIAARGIINYGVNVAMGSLWSQILYGKGYLYYLVKSLVKNTLLLPVESVLLVLLFGLTLRHLEHAGMIPPRSEKDHKWRFLPPV